MEPTGGGEAIFKLGQKHAPSPADFSRTTITNMYLSAREYEVLAALPARELRKFRRLFRHSGRVFSVDTFGGELAGLVLAEVELETHAELAEPLDLPQWVIREVSDDLRFTGGSLAACDGEQARALVNLALREGGTHEEH